MINQLKQYPKCMWIGQRDEQSSKADNTSDADKHQHARWCWAIWCSELTLAPPPHPRPSRSVWFQVKLDPSHLTFGAWIGAGWAERVKGTAVREGPRRSRQPTTAPTKGEIQLEHISVRVVEYQSLQLTENIFPSELKAASINL